MKLYEKLGIPEFSERIKKTIANIGETEMRSDLEHPEMISGKLSTLVSDKAFLAQYYYLLDEKAKVCALAPQVVKDCIDLFYGAWRETTKQWDLSAVGDLQVKRVMPWFYAFRSAVHWAGALQDWKSVARLAEYPDATCPTFNFGAAEDAYWYLWPRFLRQGNLTGCEDYMKAIEGGGKREFKLLAGLMHGIVGKDTATFNKLLDALFTYYKKTIFPRSHPPLLWMDGTFFTNLARHKDMKISYDPAFDDYMVRF